MCRQLISNTRPGVFWGVGGGWVSYKAEKKNDKNLPLMTES